MVKAVMAIVTGSLVLHVLKTTLMLVTECLRLEGYYKGYGKNLVIETWVVGPRFLGGVQDQVL